MLGPDQKWTDAPELGSVAMAADQDTDNLCVSSGACARPASRE